jgi:hypothetical protein
VVDIEVEVDVDDVDVVDIEVEVDVDDVDVVDIEDEVDVDVVDVVDIEVDVVEVDVDDVDVVDIEDEVDVDDDDADDDDGVDDDDDDVLVVVDVADVETREHVGAVLFAMVNGLYPFVTTVTDVCADTDSTKLVRDANTKGGTGDPVINGVVRAFEPTCALLTVP